MAIAFLDKLWATYVPLVMKWLLLALALSLPATAGACKEHDRGNDSYALVGLESMGFRFSEGIPSSADVHALLLEVALELGRDLLSRHDSATPTTAPRPDVREQDLPFTESNL